MCKQPQIKNFLLLEMILILYLRMILVQTIRLFDIDGNVINVNSWFECANYVNGGWTLNYSNFNGYFFLWNYKRTITFVFFFKSITSKNS